MTPRFIKTGLIALGAVAVLLLGANSRAQTELETSSVPLADNIKTGDRIGRIRFLGMLQLPNPVVDKMRFSQLSGLAWDDDDDVLYAISDKGFLFHLRPEFENGNLTGLKLLKAVRLRELGSNKPLGYGRTDCEGLDILKGRNGRKGDAELLISFERFPRIVRYRPDGVALEEYSLPAPLNDAKIYQDPNKMLESVCRDPRLGILTVPELPLKDERVGYTHIFSLKGKSWLYPLPTRNRITDMDCLGHGRVMLIESNFEGTFGRLTVSLKTMSLPENPLPNDLMPVETLVTFDTEQDHQIDNFEGLAHHRGNRFFMVSDDNDLFIQRSLLMYFEVLER
ncbi:MAG TPA: esterase-like activity of phytase family protein [Candidatus Methylomirabilis sp.]|nr:esterase-like activity of phytase family protein [Candidatus Methylomirabilis sp.]